MLAVPSLALAQGGNRPMLEALGTGLLLQPPGRPAFRADLAAALARLPVPAAGVALLPGGGASPVVAAYGPEAGKRLYQAASVSKLLTAVGALRLAQKGRLELDMDVTSVQTSWRLPPSPYTVSEKVTLRRLLAMNAGIGVPSYAGYAPGAPLPDLPRILDGEPPATSPPVRSEAVPGERWAYSGGSYEIVQALMEDVTGKPFPLLMQDLVFGPLGMTDTLFAQPLPAGLGGFAALGHDGSGETLPGGWRVVPELAAGGAWSTPRDLAVLLSDLGAAWRGQDGRLLAPAMAREMFRRTPPGPYGLGVALAGEGESLFGLKRGQNVGYQALAAFFPASGRGLVVMTGSDNGTTLANALLRRAGEALGWPLPETWPE